MGAVSDVEAAIRLLRERPGAATPFVRPTVERIVARAIALGRTIHGEHGGSR